LPTATKHPGNSGVKNNMVKLRAIPHSMCNYFSGVTKPVWRPYYRVVLLVKSNK
jgi:hypothetical protein